MQEKVIYEAALMSVIVEAREAGIDMTYEEFKERREKFELQSVEKLEALRKELLEVQNARTSNNK